jgi:hypothetical protein
MRTWDCENAEFLLSYEITNSSLYRLTGDDKKSFKADILEFEHNGPQDGIVCAWNQLAQRGRGEALMVLADDLWNTTVDWRGQIMKRVPRLIDEPWVILGDDGLNIHETWRIAGQPLITRPYYDLFGYVWYPEYKGCGCDNELFEVATGVDRLLYIPEFKYENRHAILWNGIERDHWSEVIDLTSNDQAQLLLSQTERIQSIINQTKAKLEQRHASI